MKRVRWRWTTILAVGMMLLATYSSPHSEASDWLTKGGTPLRQSVVPEMTGLMQVEEAWSQPVEVGPSATQPVVVGNRIYHLAGPYLWRIDLSETGEIIAGPTALHNGPSSSAEEVNVYRDGAPLISQSSPSYSSRTDMLYFGTAYGRLWAFDTNTGEFRSHDLEIGCPIVGSPLILEAYGREFVVVADRPDHEDEKHEGRPACPREDGQVWLAWGLESDAETSNAIPYEGSDFGGYITPSAIPASEGSGTEPTLLIGTDGFHGGRTLKMMIQEVDPGSFVLRSLWEIRSGVGFAGNFVSDGYRGYWMDTAGRLWGAQLRTSDAPPGWTTHSLDIPAMLGGQPAFTNTEPAVDVRPDGTYLYLTLRNYGYSPTVGEGGTGKAGAVVAIGPGGQLKWLHLFGPEDAHLGPDGSAAPASINTAPLAIPQSDALLFGDVNGYLYSYALTSANPWGDHRQPFFARQGQDAPSGRVSLLKEGEIPNRGQFTFSQVSGVGTDPAAGAGLILVGVNYVKNGVSGGRLVAYRLGQVYNLGWTEPPQPVELEVGKTTLVENQVAFQLFTRAGQPESTGTLLQACGAEPWISWYVARTDGSPVRDLWPKVPVPGEVASGQTRSTAMGIEGQEGDPEEGYIVGVVDLPGVMALAGEHPANPLVQEVATAGPWVTCRSLAASRRSVPRPASCPVGTSLSAG